MNSCYPSTCEKWRIEAHYLCKEGGVELYISIGLSIEGGIDLLCFAFNICFPVTKE